MQIFRCLICLVVLPSLVCAADEPDARMLRVERWLKAIVHHEPGAIDDAVVEIASWPTSDLRTFWFDNAALALLMREPRLLPIQVPVRGERRPETIRYTPEQLRRLRILACAAAGIASDRYCVGLEALSNMDDDLRRLAQRAAESRLAGDPNYVFRRGALMHTDVAMLPGSQPFDGTPANAVTAPQSVRINIADGRDTSTEQGTIHWDFARALLDAVRPDRDPMVRSWYRATASWMQAQGDYDNGSHLAHGLQLFPNDPDLLFLSGCQHETIASPAMQAALRGIDVPAGFELNVGSAESELRQAENAFRRALTGNPDLAEARLRLGRVLVVRGRFQEAAAELRRVVPALAGDFLEYVGALFLGAAEQGLGNHDAADAAYARAAAIAPLAQSPHLARSALARTRGERASALASLEHAFQLARPGPGVPGVDDGWWNYAYAPGRNADALLERLWQPFSQVQP